MIAEFNPFHVGHKMIVEKAKKETGADFFFCFMGQNFSQRGQPTIIDKGARAQMAISGGCDAVIEVPNALTLVNAEMFAKLMLKAVLSFPHITHLCFGSECGKIKPILELAKFLIDEPKCFKEFLKKYLQEGYSLNICKHKALEEVIDKNLHQFSDTKTTKTLLTLPNNILAVEYTKVLLKENSKIVPITFKREKGSATEIRTLCHNGKLKDTKKLLGDFGYEVFTKAQQKQDFPNIDLFENIKLLSARLDDFDMKNIIDISEGLDKKIFNEALNAANYQDFLTKTTSKRYGKNRIERIMLSYVLKIDKKVVENTLKRKSVPYLKVVAIKKNKSLMQEAQKSSSKIILRKTDADAILKTNKLAKELNEIDNKCEMLYSLLTQKKPNKNNIYVKTEFI